MHHKWTLFLWDHKRIYCLHYQRGAALHNHFSCMKGLLLHLYSLYKYSTPACAALILHLRSDWISVKRWCFSHFSYKEKLSRVILSTCKSASFFTHCKKVTCYARHANHLYTFQFFNCCQFLDRWLRHSAICDQCNYWFKTELKTWCLLAILQRNRFGCRQRNYTNVEINNFTFTDNDNRFITTTEMRHWIVVTDIWENGSPLYMLMWQRAKCLFSFLLFQTA